MPDFDISKPDGENRSLELAVSPHGVPETGRLYTIEARCGIAVRLSAGQRLDVINPSGTQVCDFWAFAANNLHDHLSMAHLHTSLGSIFPKPGDPLISTLRHKLMTIIEDTSAGVHDTVIASCDHARYRELGCKDYHDNCADNLRMALLAIGLKVPAIPAPFNIWMNVPVQPDGATSFQPPVARPGDRMTLRAEVDVIAAMSACPQDLSAVNGADQTPGILQFRVAG